MGGMTAAFCESSVRANVAILRSGAACSASDMLDHLVLLPRINVAVSDEKKGW